MKGIRGSVDNLRLHKIFITGVNTDPEEVQTKELTVKKKTKNNEKKSNYSIGKEKKNENNSYMEEQLSLLLEVFLTSYSKKTYADLIKDIEEKETLLYSNSILSFKILILKIKCLGKLMLKEYNNLLKLRVPNFHEVDNIIQKIQNEFNKISKLIIENNSYEYEILTQTYCKFLYLLSKISLKKEDYIKSLGFLTLGANMIKIFILRKKIATEIQTYKIYSKLLLSIANLLIGDNNYEQALFFCRLLLKVIEVSQKFIYNFNNGDNEKKISVITIKKFINFAGYAYLYTGCCFEQLGQEVEAFEAYKQAKYTLNKSSLSSNILMSANIVSINNSCNCLASDVVKRLNLKFQKDKINRLHEQQTLELLKKKQKYQLLQSERQFKLHLIANGYIGDPFKYVDLEKKIEKKLFPSNIQNDLDKIDDELVSFVYSYFNKMNRNARNTHRNKMSLKTKKLISRYELYNILLSKDFRDFVMKTKKLQFNNPKKGSESISTIQSYLNNKMEIKFEIKQRSLAKKKTSKNLLYLLEKPYNSNKVLNLFSKNKQNIDYNTNNATVVPTSTNSHRLEEKDEKIILPYTFNSSSRINNFKKRVKLKLEKENSKDIKDNTKRNNTNYSPLTISFKTNFTPIKKNKWRKNLNELECDFERKNFDKNLMTKNYLKKYSYYENLSNREIKLQKAILDFRNNNSLYKAKKEYEDLDTKIITKEDIIKKFLVINDEVKEKTNVVVKEENYDMIKDLFVKGENKMTGKMKSAMSKVINKYINDRKVKANKTIKLFNVEKIKLINEKNLLELNYSIKNINNSITHIKQKTGNKTSDNL